jgi:hypothetical protein
MGRACSTNWAKNAYMILVGKPERKKLGRRPRQGGWIILKWILDRMGWYGLDLSGSESGSMEGSCEHGNKHRVP